MKKLLLLLIALAIVPLGLLQLAGISPLAIPAALKVGTGISAKLGCSGVYLSGYSQQQIAEDVASYSPLTRSIDMQYEDGLVTARIPGLASASARFYPGLGCTLQFPDMADLAALAVPVLPARSGEWPAGEDTGAMVPSVQRAAEALLAADAGEGLDTRAVLVVQGGRIVAETYADDIGPETPLLGWSMGKTISALLLGRMEAQGLLSVDDVDLFEAWRGDNRREITLRQLLQMSSGLDFREPYVPGSDSTRMLFFAPSAAAVALESGIEHPPGSFFYYSSGTSNLLGLLAWQLLGSDSQALIDYFAREIAIPLRLGNTFMELDASGVYVGSSYVYASARDWARLGLWMLDDGVVNGERLLPEGWVARAVAPNPSRNEPRYGYQTWLNGGGEALRWPLLDPGAYAMMGNRGQAVMMLPAHNAVIVRLGWTAGDYPFGDKLAPIQQALAGS